MSLICRRVIPIYFFFQKEYESVETMNSKVGLNVEFLLRYCNVISIIKWLFFSKALDLWPTERTSTVVLRASKFSVLKLIGMVILWFVITRKTHMIHIDNLIRFKMVCTFLKVEVSFYIRRKKIKVGWFWTKLTLIKVFKMRLSGT